MKISFKIILLTFVSLAFNVCAETIANITPQNEAAIADDGLGVEIKFDKYGNLLSLRSTYRHPVEFGDRRGISKAYIIAEEKAKANIARYLNQLVTTSRITTEIDDSLNKSTRSRNSTGESWSKDNTRNVVESIKEITTSSSSALLRGVRIIERSYAEKDEEVKVVVGINRESQAGADQLSKGIANSGDESANKSKNSNFPSVGSEVKRSRDVDKF